jgi:dTDP-4-amino-4,6-dideoxygalactose transaminase
MTYLIPHFGLARQYANLKEELLEATDLSMRNGILIGGEFTEQFEIWLRDRVGSRFATVVHSGTNALEFLASYYYENNFTAQPPKIRIPNLTFPATLNAFLGAGWEVELVDTDSNGLFNFDSEDDYSTFSCFVGLYGASTHDDHRFKLNTIVDGAQHWLSVNPVHVGRAMAISFDPTKNLPSSGNGGAIVTDDQQLYKWINETKNNGKPGDHRYVSTNSKMSELECSHMLVRTKYIDEWQARRKEIRHHYLERFEDLPVKCLSKGFDNHTDQKFVIYTQQRHKLHSYLYSKKIESRIHYPYGLSELPIASEIKQKPDLISTSIALSRGVISLPIYPELTDGEVEVISNTVREFFDK